MMHEQVEPGLPVGAQHLAGHRDELGGAAAGARAFGEIGDPPRPADIDQLGEGGTPIAGPEILVPTQRHRRLERLHVADRGKIVLAAEPGRRGAGEKAQQALTLNSGGVLLPEPDSAVPGIEAQQRRRVDHAGCNTVRCGNRARAVSGLSSRLKYPPRRNSSAWSRKAGLPGCPSWPPSSTR